MPTERFDVNLTLRAQRMGEAAFAQTEAGLKVVRDAVKRYSEAQANGLVANEAYKESISSFKRDAIEAGLSFEGQAQAVRDVTRAIDRFREAEAVGIPFDEAVAISTAENAAASEVRASATNSSSDSLVANAIASLQQEAATDSATGAVAANSAAEEEDAATIFILTSMLEAHSAAWYAAALAIASAAAAAVLAIWPLIVAITTATVAMVGWVVAGAAGLILLGALTIGFAGLGVGLIAIANHFREVDPWMKRFTGHFKAMGEEWADRARPAVNELLRFLDRLLPAIGRTGDSIIQWFSKELPKVLAGISKLLKDLSPDFIAFGKFMATAFDQAGPVLFKFFEIVTRGGLSAIEGLTTNLIRLANWFNKESPKWQPIWDQVGRAVQWLAGIWEKFNDWLIANWPGTMAQVQGFIDQIQKGWEKWGPLIEKLAGLVMQFVNIGLQAIIDHGEVLIPLLLGIGLNFLAVIVVLAIVAGAFLTAADAIANFISNTDNQFTNWANSVIGAINTVIDGLNRIPGVHINPVALIPIPETGGGGTNQGKGGHGKLGGKPDSHSTSRKHSGGLVVEGEAYIIGKSGAEELFIPERGGRVYPINGQDVYVEAQGGAGGGGGTGGSGGAGGSGGIGEAGSSSTGDTVANTNVVGPVIKSDSSIAASVSSVVNDLTDLQSADSKTSNQTTQNRRASASWLASLFSKSTTQNIANENASQSVKTTTSSRSTNSSQSNFNSDVKTNIKVSDPVGQGKQIEGAQGKGAIVTVTAHGGKQAQAHHTSPKPGTTTKTHSANQATVIHNKAWAERHKTELTKEATQDQKEIDRRYSWLPPGTYPIPPGANLAPPPPPVPVVSTAPGVSTVANTRVTSSGTTSNKIVNELDHALQKPLNVKGIDEAIALLRAIEADLDAMRRTAPGITAAVANRRNG